MTSGSVCEVFCLFPLILLTRVMTGALKKVDQRCTAGDSDNDDADRSALEWNSFLVPNLIILDPHFLSLSLLLSRS